MHPSPETVRAHVRVSGRVQGVYFRYSVQDEAARLGMAGWVRNTREGRVEAVFEGRREAVEALVAFCRRGPPAAIVKDIEVEWEEPEGLSGFAVRYEEPSSNIR
ncbi:MAG: acylphosphatase [Methanomicrobiaceae archaeon]|nr:acylphosphatase [Methanomicrobiaceae archaeon]